MHIPPAQLLPERVIIIIIIGRLIGTADLRWMHVRYPVPGFLPDHAVRVGV